MNKRIGTVLVGFVAGALSVLIFHQLGFWIANQLGYTRVPLYNMRGVPPWGVPYIISAAFWGGLWGIAAAFLVPRMRGVMGGFLGWILFAAVVVSLANWFVVLPLKSGGTFRMPTMPILAVLPMVYGLWGFGMWLIGRLLRAAPGWR